MSSYSVAEVFRPKAMPSYTYVNRIASGDGVTYEAKLKKALSSTGSLISITGASKTGKTVLVRKVIHEEKIVDISGSQIQTQDDFWGQIAEKLEVPNEWQTEQHSQEATGAKNTAGMQGGVFSFLSARFSGEVSSEQTEGTNISRKIVRNRSLIVKTLIQGKFVLVIDDFHYIRPEIQQYISRTLKAELFNGLSAILISLPHRADDAIRRNPDLIGRTIFIDMGVWSMEDLKAIAQKGFSLLGMRVGEADIEKLAEESALSPQLMQENCLNLAYRLEDGRGCEAAYATVEKAFADTAENYQHYYDTVQKVLEGPAKGRTRRKQYRLADGGVTCDIYALLLLSISASPPQLRFSLDEIKERMSALLMEEETLPTRLSLSNIVKHMEKIIQGAIPGLDSVEWARNMFHILDPFFLFYLRWCGDWKQAIRGQL